MAKGLKVGYGYFDCSKWIYGSGILIPDWKDQLKVVHERHWVHELLINFGGGRLELRSSVTSFEFVYRCLELSNLWKEFDPNTFQHPVFNGLELALSRLKDEAKVLVIYAVEE